MITSGKWKLGALASVVLGTAGTLVYEMVGWKTKARGPTGWHKCGETAAIEVWTDLPCPKQGITVSPGAQVQMIPKLAAVKKDLLTP